MTSRCGGKRYTPGLAAGNMKLCPGCEDCAKPCPTCGGSGVLGKCTCGLERCGCTFSACPDCHGGGVEQ